RRRSRRRRRPGPARERASDSRSARERAGGPGSGGERATGDGLPGGGLALIRPYYHGNTVHGAGAGAAGRRRAKGEGKPKGRAGRAGRAEGEGAGAEAGARRGDRETAGGVVARVRGLGKRYGAAPVLTGLDAAFEAGTLHAVTGPSGSGKTTFLHLLAGLELPDAGSVEVGGVELTRLDRAARARLRREAIAYVGQQAGLVPHLSALENVELAVALRGAAGPAARAYAALEAVGLGERAAQRVARLSQGERARVAIA